MTIHLSDDLASSIRAQVLSGIFASEDDMVAAAVRDFLHRQSQQAAANANTPPSLTPEDIADQDLQRRLLAAGVISEIKPQITDMTPYRNRRAVPIQGEPLSQTVIRERR
jgi:Arc/MetJ-type ribon-helix-helix transcriptional regulator